MQGGTTQVDRVLICNIPISSARVTTGAALILLDTRSRHVGFLTVRLREAVTSTSRGGAAEPAVSVNVEEPAPNALLPPPELVKPPTKPATQDPDDDVESLRQLVHNIKTVVEKVPETSEVCWTMFVSKQHFTGALSHPFAALALRKHCLESHVLSAQGMGNTSCLVSYSHDFAHHRRPLRNIM